MSNCLQCPSGNVTFLEINVSFMKIVVSVERTISEMLFLFSQVRFT